jgi:glycosyl transferase family 25
MQSLLDQHGIEPIWFEAVDGRLLSEEVLARQFNASRAQSAYGPMARAEIGTSLSHIGIYRQMVAQGMASAVILEDDILLAKDFGELLQTQGEQGLASVFSKEDAVMVQLTHVSRGYRSGAMELGHREIVRTHGGVWLTSGYFITLAAAQHMLEALYPVWMVADHWRYFEREGLLRLYALTPNAVWESPLSQISDITPDRHDRRRDSKSMVDRLKKIWDTIVVRPLQVKDLPRFNG